MAQFFAAPDNKRLLADFQSRLNRYTEEAAARPGFDVAPRLIQLVTVIHANAEVFDTLCEVNISQIGRRFLDRVTAFEPKDAGADKLLLGVFVLAYRFLLEVAFKQEGELTEELNVVRIWVNDHMADFPEDTRQHLAWAHYVMPADLARRLIKAPNVQAFVDFSSAIERSAKLQTEWVEELKQRTAEVDALRQSLSQYKSTYNFVGLVDAFRQLLAVKLKEKSFAFASLISLGCLLIAPLGIEIYYVLINLSNIDTLKTVALLLLPGTIAVELLLFYFFRVVLLHFRTVKAHILQLELRAALCQFIQSYATYASGIKKSDAAALDRFESIVFSGIISSDEKLPATFDGAEQIAGLIKSLRGG